MPEEVFDVPVWALLMLAAAAGLWALLLLALTTATRPRPVRPGPATLDLGGAEPPAVVNLLTNGWRMTTDALSATLLDLAARDLVDLVQTGPEPERTICKIRAAAPAEPTPYERRVYERVAGLAAGGVVPVAALARGNSAQASRWWNGFRREVIVDAQRRGLSRNRWGAAIKTLTSAASLLPAAAAGLVTYRAADDGDPVWGVAALTWLALSAYAASRNRQRDTPAGRAAAARWLGVRDHLGRNEVFDTLPPAAVAIWDRYLGYGAAAGVAGTASRVLSFGAQDERLAWSAYGGTWHKVRIPADPDAERRRGQRQGAPGRAGGRQVGEDPGLVGVAAPDAGAAGAGRGQRDRGAVAAPRLRALDGPPRRGRADRRRRSRAGQSGDRGGARAARGGGRAGRTGSGDAVLAGRAERGRWGSRCARPAAAASRRRCSGWVCGWRSSPPSAARPGWSCRSRPGSPGRSGPGGASSCPAGRGCGRGRCSSGSRTRWSRCTSGTWSRPPPTRPRAGWPRWRRAGRPSLAGPQHRWSEQGRRTGTVELGRPAPAAGGVNSSFDRAPLHPVGQDRVVVEGEPRRPDHRHPARVGRVASRGRRRQTGASTRYATETVRIRGSQTPSRERVQQEADRATHERRALAVQRERAIAENELQNQIELRSRSRGRSSSERQSSSGVIGTAPALVRFVREARPSPATGTSPTEGTGELELTAETDGLVAFGDGIERDRLTLARGQTATVRRAVRTLRLVRR